MTAHTKPLFLGSGLSLGSAFSTRVGVGRTAIIGH